MNAEDYRLAALGDADAQVRVADYYDEYLRGEHDGPIDVSDETAKEYCYCSWNHRGNRLGCSETFLRLKGKRTRKVLYRQYASCL